MRKKYLIVMAVFGIAGLFFATGIYAGTVVQDVIKMDNKAYAKHKKSIVMFSHKKHIEEYKAGCGECHHDADNKPLDNLKAGDDVQNCIECHKIASERPKGKDAPKLTKKQRLEYHAEQPVQSAIPKRRSNYQQVFIIQTWQA
jgi:cytochrome c553